MSDAAPFTKIFVPLDGSDVARRALPIAAALATPESEIVAIEIVSSGGHSHDDVAADARVVAQLAEWNSIFAKQPTVLAETGHPANAIVEAAVREDASLIAIATHGRGAFGRWLHGSVADEIARTSPTPVVVLNADESTYEIKPTMIKRLLVPYDGSDFSAEAFPVAEGLAKRLTVGVHIVRAVELVPPTALGMGMEPAFPATAYTDLENELEGVANESVTSACQHFNESGVNATGEVLLGAAIAAITTIVEPGDLVVMVSRSSGGLSRFIMGSLAEALIHDGHAPVLLVRSTATTPVDE